MQKSTNYIPLGKISTKYIEGEGYFIFHKICEVLFSGCYSEFCINFTRSCLDFLVSAKFLTHKQVKLIISFNPKNK